MAASKWRLCGISDSPIPRSDAPLGRSVCFPVRNLCPTLSGFPSPFAVIFRP
jgi:hypothetical protein